MRVSDTRPISSSPAALVVRIGATIAVLLATTRLSAALAACAYANEPIEPVWSTFAGTGLPGNADGTALAASFVEPRGLAAGPDGAVYVADPGTQSIRRIAGGVVSTFAGTSTPGATKEQRIGGYVDGPAASAKFNLPMGVAVARDGTVYVADLLNHAIRIISHGEVGTLTKSLEEPYGVAVDGDDNVFVADRATGVRQVFKDGTLSAFETISHTNDRAVCGVAVTGSGASRSLAWTDSKSLHVVEGSQDRTVAFDDPVEPIYEKKTLGAACNLAFLDRDTLIESDLYDNDVRLVRLSLAEPVGEPVDARTLARGRDDSALLYGGFENGPISQARVDVPAGFAVLRDGTVLMADSGNRRIRSIEHIDFRHAVAPDTSGSLAIAPFDPKSYRVVVIGNSQTFTNATWPESIAGHIERGLIANRPTLGPAACPAVQAFRLSGAGVGDLSDFITTYFGDGQADLVVFLVNGSNTEKDVFEAVRATKLATGDLGNPNAPANDATGWRETMTKKLRTLDRRLRENRTRLTLVYLPDGPAVSPLENLRGDSLDPRYHDFYTVQRPEFITYELALEEQHLFAASGVRTIPLLDSMIAAEEGATRTPLYGMQDDHLSPAGNAFVGEAISKNLEAWAPWRSAGR